MIRYVVVAAVLGCSGPPAPTPPPPAPAPHEPAVATGHRRVPIAVTVDSPEHASDNRVAIQKAIDDNAGKGVTLELPRGTIYVDVGAHFDSIRMAGVATTDLDLVGRGVDATKLVVQGDAHGGLWLGIEIVDGPRRIILRDFSIQHGTIDNRSPTQQDHLIQINAQTAMTGDIEIANIHFGPCVGDALRIAGTAPNFVEHVRAHDFVMETAGQPQSPKARSRSGLSLQRGFRDVEVYNFTIRGARGSPIDMEPTGPDVMDHLHIHDGTVDNSQGDTVYAVSLGGYEGRDDHHVSPLADSVFEHVKILEGQLNILNSSNLTIRNVTLYASANGPMANASEPLVYVFHENRDLKLDHVDITRDRGAGHGPLVLVAHGVGTFPSNITIDGGTWISRVDAIGKPPFVVSFESAQHVSMSNIELHVEGANPHGTYAIKVRSSARDSTDVSFDHLHITSPNGKLTAGIWIAATNEHRIGGIRVRHVKAPDAADTGVLFDGTSIESDPILEDNELGSKAWGASHAAMVTPRSSHP